VFGEESESLGNQLGLGENLVGALATGKSWLTDSAKLQRLSEMTKVRRLHQQRLDVYLKIWEDQPLTIFVNHDSNEVRFESRAIRVSLDERAQRKARSIPFGTKFLLSISPIESAANDQTIAELRTFLSSHGMSVVGEKRAH
jgi:hypothetical protein